MLPHGRFIGLPIILSCGWWTCQEPPNSSEDPVATQAGIEAWTADSHLAHAAQWVGAHWVHRLGGVAAAE